MPLHHSPQNELPAANDSSILEEKILCFVACWGNRQFSVDMAPLFPGKRYRPQIETVSICIIKVTLKSLQIYNFREKIDFFIKQQASSLACKQPDLELFNPEMLQFLKKVSPINCDKAGDDWVKCRVSLMHFIHSPTAVFLKNEYNNIIKNQTLKSRDVDEKCAHLHEFCAFSNCKSPVIK